jgi:hypothetical protein
LNETEFDFLNIERRETSVPSTDHTNFQIVLIEQKRQAYEEKDYKILTLYASRHISVNKSMQISN